MFPINEQRVVRTKVGLPVFMDSPTYPPSSSNNHHPNEPRPSPILRQIFRKMQPQLFLALLFCTSGLFAQTDYFQQQTDYTIEATLDEQNHTLSGDYRLVYTNNAPDPLDTLYFHLWPNAYSGPNTAYARQELRLGSTRFHFADPKLRGELTDMAWRVDEQPATFVQDPTHPDIGQLILNQPLPPGERIDIRTPFTLKIPGSFSRLGRVGTSYQFTQWYPKPAVYDREGWHPMPYLDQGEFYSEFGSFDVTLTLPENYVVAATGELQTDSERTFLQEKERETEQYFAELDALGGERKIYVRDSFPAGSSALKTIRYTADQVHDFAWFADKRFLVDIGQVELNDERMIDTYTFFTREQAPLWRDALDYVNRSVRFYSDEVGNYPWPQATAVQSALSAGGGMEYPMITVIGYTSTDLALDEVITHEVGHNWFYGILANNERPYAWMDEGLNSFYEGKYMERNYGTGSAEELVPKFVKKMTNETAERIFYLMLARRHADQAPNTHSDSLTRFNYGLGAYSKPADALAHLEGYLGEERFSAMMRNYYEQWKFRHPQPADLRRSFEESTGEDLSWFFDGFIDSNQRLDYRFGKVERKGKTLVLEVKNEGEIAAPFAVGTKVESSDPTNAVAELQWFPGIEPGASKAIRYTPAENGTLVQLDPAHVTMEYKRQGDQVTLEGKKQTPVRLAFVGAVENTRKRTLSVLPLPGYNITDGFLLGAALHNYSILEKPFEFFVTPQYGFGSGEWNGIVNARYNLYTPTDQKLTFQLDARSYNIFEQETLDYLLRYVRIAPSVQLDLKSYPTASLTQRLYFRPVLLLNEVAQFTDGSFSGTDFNEQWLLRLGYELKRKDALSPSTFGAMLEQRSYTDVFGNDQDYLNLQLTYENRYFYKRDRSFQFRAFAGYFLQNTARDRNSLAPGFFNLSMTGYADDFDYLYLGRPTDGESITYRQIYLRDGGFKNAFPRPFANQAGGTNHLLVAVNLKSDLPQRLPGGVPLKPYFDLAFVGNRSDNVTFGDQIWYSGGFALELADGAVGVYFPLISSSNIRDLYDQDGVGDPESGFKEFLSKITFTVDLPRLNPVKVLNDNVQ